MKYKSVMAALALAVSLADGQEKNISTAQPEANQIEVRFADGSLVKMALIDTKVDVATRYGKLSVPVEEIRRIEFGFRVSEAIARRVDAAIAKLGNAKEREAASSELITLRESAVPALQKASRGTDAEIARRAKEVLQTLTSTVPADQLHLPRHDTIVAIDFTIVGQVENAVFKAKSPYFGETALKVAEVRNIRWLGSELGTKVVVDAGKYGGQHESWLDSGIEVRSGAALQVAASGFINMDPDGGGSITRLGPDGMARRFGGFGGAAGGPGGGMGGPGGGGGRGGLGRGGFGAVQSPGALIGRIGETGRTFFVGSHFDAVAPEDGRLYLRIVPSPAGGMSTGSFDVRVTTGR